MGVYEECGLQGFGVMRKGVLGMRMSGEWELHGNGGILGKSSFWVKGDCRGWNLGDSVPWEWGSWAMEILGSGSPLMGVPGRGNKKNGGPTVGVSGEWRSQG